MKIIKILNNNAVIVNDHEQEKIAIGSGIGFGKRKNDLVSVHQIEKLFILKENQKLQQLLLRIPEEHILISEEIIDYAEMTLGAHLDEHVLLTLTDHLSFAIEREKQGIHLKNKLLQEIKILYRQEYEVGLWAIQQMKEKWKIEMPVDEAAFIALHIHTMKMKGSDLHDVVRQTSIIKDMVDMIKQCLHISIQEDDIAYERLVNHLRFALTRTQHMETHTMDAEMLDMIKRKFARSFQCAKEISQHLSSLHDISLPEEELGYITLHIERLRTA